MAIGALGVATILGVLMVFVYPPLIDVVHSVRSASLRQGNGGMANGALDDFAGVALQVRAVKIIVGLECRILRVLRSMARRAVHGSMSRAETVQVFPACGLVRVCRERCVRRHAPVATGIERRRITRTAGMAHLARRQIKPPLTRCNSDFAQISVTVITGDLVHGTALAFGLLSRMAKVARRERCRCVVKARASRGVDHRTVHGMHVHCERIDAGHTGSTQRIGGMTCGAKNRCSRLGSLIQARLVRITMRLQYVQVSCDVPSVVMLLEDVQLCVLGGIRVVLPTRSGLSRRITP